MGLSHLAQAQKNSPAIVLPQIQLLTCLAKEKGRVTVEITPQNLQGTLLALVCKPTPNGLVKGQSSTLCGTAPSVWPLTALLFPILP